MGVIGKNIAILVDNYFEESEFVMSIKILRENKISITIVSANGKKLQAMNGAAQGKTFAADLLLEDADDKDYDALVLPGGLLNANSLRVNEKAQSWAIDLIDSSRPVAVFGYSSLLLVSADLIEEKQLTSPPEVQDDIKNAGGEWTNRPVVVDRNLITCKGSEDSENLINSLLKQLS